MQVFADTSFLVAFYNKKDKNHQRARSFISESDKNTAFIISDYIFDEVLTVLLVRGGKSLSIEAGRKILEDERIGLLQIDEEVFQKAWLIYQGFQDKEWSFTDCISYVLMKNLSIGTGASFDNHFNQFGFITIPE
ncbi:MAG: type II toxin-antitoxin system VapC family toxin [Deltaproteobacteria bacterium]|nr:type II toxin-antitoxin system VapC family toxin [Deltaproteobacteria bacterium]